MKLFYLSRFSTYPKRSVNTMHMLHRMKFALPSNAVLINQSIFLQKRMNLSPALKKRKLNNSISIDKTLKMEKEAIISSKTEIISLSHKIINSNGHKNIDNIMIDTLYVSDYVSKHKLNPSKLLSQIENESEYIPRSKMTFTIYGKTMELPRDKQFYGDTLQNGYKPLYRYGGNYLPKVYDFPKTLKMLRDKVKEYQYCNHCVLNRYKNGTDYIGFHRDKTKDFLVNSGVIILSFGTERILRFKRDDNIIKKIILKANNNNNDKVEIDMIKKLPKLVNLRLKSGSLCFVGDKTNTYYKHSIVKQSKNVIKGKRISLTLRNIHTQFKPGKNGKPATIIEATKK
eukprot:476735_1